MSIEEGRKPLFSGTSAAHFGAHLAHLPPKSGREKRKVSLSAATMMMGKKRTVGGELLKGKIALPLVISPAIRLALFYESRHKGREEAPLVSNPFPFSCNATSCSFPPALSFTRSKHGTTSCLLGENKGKGVGKVTGSAENKVFLPPSLDPHSGQLEEQPGSDRHLSSHPDLSFPSFLLWATSEGRQKSHFSFRPFFALTSAGCSEWGAKGEEMGKEEVCCTTKNVANCVWPTVVEWRRREGKKRTNFGIGHLFEAKRRRS